MTGYNPDDLVEYRLQRSRETIKEVEILIKNEFWNTAISRMYYACFYAVGALLLKHGVMVSTHDGVRRKFGELFVKTGKIDRSLSKHFTDLNTKRSKGDYDDFIDYDKETVNSLLPLSKNFIESIEKLIKE